MIEVLWAAVGTLTIILTVVWIYLTERCPICKEHHANRSCYKCRQRVCKECFLEFGNDEDKSPLCLRCFLRQEKRKEHLCEVCGEYTKEMVCSSCNRRICFACTSTSNIICVGLTSPQKIVEEFKGDVEINVFCPICYTRNIKRQRTWEDKSWLFKNTSDEDKEKVEKGKELETASWWIEGDINE